MHHVWNGLNNENFSWTKNNLVYISVVFPIQVLAESWTGSDPIDEKSNPNLAMVLVLDGSSACLSHVWMPNLDRA